MEELEERVSYLEREVRRHHHLIDATEKRTDVQVREVNAHLDRQDKDIQELKVNVQGVKCDIRELKEDVNKRFDSIDKRFDSIDKRFEHVYGALADLNANMIEVRNILATLVQKLEK
jgi:prefoldin subunit 5